jgi:hypothetical protein
MAWSLSDSATTTFADGNAGHVYTFPHAAVAGDLLIFGVNSDTTVSTPSGYTLATSDVAHMGAYVFYKVAAGGETTVTLTTAGNFQAAMSFLRYAGADPAPGDQVAHTRVLDQDIPQASPAVAPASISGADDLCLLFGMAHHSVSSTAVAGVTASAGYSVLLTTAAAGGLNATSSTMHFVIGRTGGTGLQTPQVSWTGGTFQDITSLFVSFLPGPQTVSPTGIASAESVGAPDITTTATSFTLVTETVTEYHVSPDPFRSPTPSNRLRYRIGIGASLLRIGGVWRAVTGPSEELLATADLYYRGGRFYTITSDIAVTLIAQGFGSLVTED